MTVAAVIARLACASHACRRHLSPGAKTAACREFARVLKRDGACYVADFAPPRSVWAHLASIVPRLTCFRHIGENFRGGIPPLLRAAGFIEIEELFQTASSVSLHRARLSAARHRRDAVPGQGVTRFMGDRYASACRLASAL